MTDVLLLLAHGFVECLTPLNLTMLFIGIVVGCFFPIFALWLSYRVGLITIPAEDCFHRDGVFVGQGNRDDAAFRLRSGKGSDQQSGERPGTRRFNRVEPLSGGSHGVKKPS